MDTLFRFKLRITYITDPFPRSLAPHVCPSFGLVTPAAEGTCSVSLFERVSRQWMFPLEDKLSFEPVGRSVHFSKIPKKA